jgi:hypothetical protein
MNRCLGDFPSELTTELGIAGAPDNYVQYAIVATHRSVQMGVLEGGSNNYGPWLSQYTEHLVRENTTGGTRKATTFKFDDSKQYTGRVTITLAQLDSWIVRSVAGSALRVFANRWDEAQIAYHKHSRQGDATSWQALRQCARQVTLLEL